jgi:hypothetical protein
MANSGLPVFGSWIFSSDRARGAQDRERSGVHFEVRTKASSVLLHLFCDALSA